VNNKILVLLAVCPAQVPLAVARPTEPLASPGTSKKKSSACGSFFSRAGRGNVAAEAAAAVNFSNVACAPVLPPAGGTLADVVLQAGDRVLLQVRCDC
jgi:hypothetical protein